VKTGVALLDSDTLSELARGHPRIVTRTRSYLEAHGRVTLSAITVFERLRGYRSALARGKPFEPQLAEFLRLCAASVVLPIDQDAADHAATIWDSVGARTRGSVEDLLIAGTASARRLVLVTRNRRDFEPMARAAPFEFSVVDWGAP
jgi:predicted nucleic acid-binding protein